MKIRLYILTTLAALLLAGCAKEPPETPDDNPDGPALSFSYKSGRGVISRAIAMDYENVIHDLDVFAFAEDGLCRHLAAGTHYTENHNAGTTTIAATKALLTEYAGQSVVFYFVGNNARSMDYSTLTADGAKVTKHISAFSGTEAEFVELLTQPLGDYIAGYPSFGAEYFQITPTTGGMLMTARQSVKLTGKHHIAVTLKRRMARFDLVNPAPANLNISGIIVAGANPQGAMFGEATGPHTITPRAIALIDPPGLFDNAHAGYDAANRSSGLLYLYPTKLGDAADGQTQIVIKGWITGTDPQDDELNFAIKGTHEILPNKRYTLVFDEVTSQFIIDPSDWIDGGGITVGP